GVKDAHSDRGGAVRRRREYQLPVGQHGPGPEPTDCADRELGGLGLLIANHASGGRGDHHPDGPQRGGDGRKQRDANTVRPKVPAHDDLDSAASERRSAEPNVLPGRLAAKWERAPPPGAERELWCRWSPPWRRAVSPPLRSPPARRSGARSPRSR